ncbi:MAG: hypothetical protein WC881_11735 [Elusimicrobiota bacterium]|jgi:hypothetical protein
MTTLWGDGWFYISALGLMVSSALFLYLLGQYRTAVEESESDEDMAAPMLTTLTVPTAAAERSVPPVPAAAPLPVVTPLAAPSARPEEKTVTLPPVAAVRPAPEPIVPAPAPAPEKRRSDSTSTGSLSPAVVYLQNIKAQMEKFDKEIADLKSLAAQQSAQGEIVLKRISELGESIKAAGAQPVKLPPPARSVELSLESLPPEEPILSAAPRRAAPVMHEPEPVVSLEPPAEPPAAAPEPEPAPAPEVMTFREVQEEESSASAASQPEPAVEPAPVPEPAAAPEPSVPAVPNPAPPVTQPLEQTEDRPKTRKGPVWPV